MAIAHSLCFPILLILSSQCIFISGTWAADELQHRIVLERKRGYFSSLSSKGRRLLNIERKLDDFMNPGPDTTGPSTTPITNPANFPPYTPTPTVVTVPASNPTSVTPVNPLPTPITTVPTSTTPTPITNPAAPVTNPVTTPSTEGNIPATGGNIPGTSPSTSTTPTTGAPITAGQTWCIAKAGSPESTLQSGLDYACGIGGADCSTIQEGSSCYEPNSLENHASYAFNSYFQKNPVATSCDFGGAAVIVNTNPSTGSCIYPSSATSTTATPSSTFPPATTTSTSGATGSPPGFTGSSSDSPPPLFNTNYPTSGSPAFYGPDSPPTGNSLPAGSTALQPVIGFVIMVASFSAGKLILSV